MKCHQAIGSPIVAPLLQIDRWCGLHVSDWERVSVMFSSAASIPSNKGRTPVFIFKPKHSAFCWKEIKKYRGKIVSAVRGFLSRIAMKRFLEKWFRTGIGKWS